MTASCARASIFSTTRRSQPAPRSLLLVDQLLPSLLRTLWTSPARGCTAQTSTTWSSRPSTRLRLSSPQTSQFSSTRSRAQNPNDEKPLYPMKRKRSTRQRSLPTTPPVQVVDSPPSGPLRGPADPDPYTLSGPRDEFGMLKAEVDIESQEPRRAETIKDNRRQPGPGVTLDKIGKPYSFPEPERYAGKSARQLRRLAVTDRDKPALPQAQNSTRPLLLTMDAFDTIFTPKDPIPNQYAEVAARHGIEAHPAYVSADFRAAFKEMSTRSPNYGKATGMTPKAWWSRVISDTFSRRRYPEMTAEIRSQLTNDLYKRFSSKAGYRLFEDVEPFLQHVGTSFQASTWGPRRTMLGIVSNSDPRVIPILKSLQIYVKPALYPPRFAPKNRYERGPDFGPARLAFATLSYNAGMEKPDPSIFEQALTDAQGALVSIHAVGRLTRTAHDLLSNILTDFHHMHIGDSLKKDVIPAIKAGWDGIWLDRSSTMAIRDILADEHGNIRVDPAPLEAGSIVRESHHREDPHKPMLRGNSGALYRVTAVNALTALPQVVTKARLEGAYTDTMDQEHKPERNKWIASRHGQLNKVADPTAPQTSRRAKRRGLGVGTKHAPSLGPQKIINRWGREETRRLVEID